MLEISLCDMLAGRVPKNSSNHLNHVSRYFKTSMIAASMSTLDLL